MKNPLQPDVIVEALRKGMEDWEKGGYQIELKWSEARTVGEYGLAVTLQVKSVPPGQDGQAVPKTFVDNPPVLAKELASQVLVDFGAWGAKWEGGEVEEMQRNLLAHFESKFLALILQHKAAP